MPMDTKLIDEILQRIRSELPEGFKSFRDDVEKNLRAVLQGIFSKLYLVSREEFDVQTEVLARAREKIDRLEKQLRKLEQAADKKVAKKNPSGSKH